MQVWGNAGSSGNGFGGGYNGNNGTSGMGPNKDVETQMMIMVSLVGLAVPVAVAVAPMEELVSLLKMVDLEVLVVAHVGIHPVVRIPKMVLGEQVVMEALFMELYQV